MPNIIVFLFYSKKKVSHNLTIEQIVKMTLIWNMIFILSYLAYHQSFSSYTSSWCRAHDREQEGGSSLNTEHELSHEMPII